MTSETDLLASDVSWDLADLLGGQTVENLMSEAAQKAEGLTAWRGKLTSVTPDEFLQLMQGLADLTELVGRAGNYVGLMFSVNTADPAIGALMQKVEEQGTAIQTQLIFLDLEWVELSEDRAEELLADDRLTFCQHYLRSMRRYQPHILSEAEEVILKEKEITGTNAWSRLFSELASDITVDTDDGEVPLEAALSRLAEPSRDTRQQVAEQVTQALQPGLRTRAFIYNTLMADKTTDDRLRKYPNWIASRNLGNEASDASVQALVEAVRKRYEIPQRWYTLKAQLLGIPRLADYDRMAPLTTQDQQFGWEEARKIVMDSYTSFSPEMANVANEFFEHPWIDAPTRPAKRPGAFCAYTIPSEHPYVLLNWTSRRRDVLTLAHELGHAIHAYLARPQGVFHQATPLTLAETASVFGETVTFGRLLSQTTDPKLRLALLAESLEGTIATVFRQTAMHCFEAAVHEERREVGELSTDRFGELWYETQSEMLGDAVEITDGYKSWWSYVPHFIATPGYVYAYAYGQLLALAVYNKYEQDGPAFVPRYVEMLSAGGSMSPEELGRIVGVDLADPQFWDGGLDIVERQLAAAEQAAAQ